jgi:chromosome segregation ATPase
MSKSGLAWAAVCAALAVGLLWQGITLRSALRGKEYANAALTRQVAQLKAAAPRPSFPAAAEAVRPQRSPDHESGEVRKMAQALADKDEALSKVQNDLVAARAQAGDLENTVLTLQSQSAAQSQQSEQKLSAAEASYRQRIADLQDSIDRIQASLAHEKQKTTELQTDKELLVAKLAAPAKPAHTELMAQFRDLTEQREGYLKTLASRYREITSQYRSLSGALAGRQDQQSAPWNSAELSRIQSAISSADEDLRRLDELNSKAALLEKKLGKP